MNFFPINETHDPARRSWVLSANDQDCDFPIQNLPFGRFRRRGGSEPPRIGVAIGDSVLDLQATGLIAVNDMNVLMAMSVQARAELRGALSVGLAVGSDHEVGWASALLPLTQAELELPCTIGDYTDFYTSVHHATSVGKRFRPQEPLLPNYKWVPIGYHGRSSSIIVSGNDFHRPIGQTRRSPGELPVLKATERLDHELELGIFVGMGNAHGKRIDLVDAEAHAFGLVLLNDWSARDIQAWEYQPLGPFLSKNFATTISPWVITMEALAPFRSAHTSSTGDPEPLPYLDSIANRQRGGLDISLEAWIETDLMRSLAIRPQRLSRSNFKDAYWTIGQMIAHHSVNGCNLRPGDLLGTGTQSGPEPEAAGSMLELSAGGEAAVQLVHGELRTFLHDGDRIALKAFCGGDGLRRIGFGSCEGRILPFVPVS